MLYILNNADETYSVDDRDLVFLETNVPETVVQAVVDFHEMSIVATAPCTLTWRDHGRGLPTSDKLANLAGLVRPSWEGDWSLLVGIEVRVNECTYPLALVEILLEAYDNEPHNWAFPYDDMAGDVPNWPAQARAAVVQWIEAGGR